MIDDVDNVLEFAILREAKWPSKDVVTNYEEIKTEIVAKLKSLLVDKIRQRPSIWHYDVAAMYPNIILTNRLQPSALVDEAVCSTCIFNKPENNW